MRRLWIGLGGLALVIAGVAALVLWGHGDGPPAKTRAPQANAQPSPPPATPAPAAEAPSTTAPSFDIVKIDPSGHAVIAGRAAPGAKVTIHDGNKTLGEVTADNRGEWVLVPTEPMAAGERQLTLEATDPSTGAKTKSTDTVALAVGAPTGGASNTVAVLLPGNGDQPAQALQTPNAHAGKLSLDTAEYNDKGDLMLSGHATPGANLRLYADNQSLGAAQADEGGKWSLVSPHPRGTAKANIRVDQLAADGSVAQRVEEPFETPPKTTATGRYTVQDGNSLWVIARKIYGSGLQYTVIYDANKAHISDPNLIYPGQIITLPKS